MGSLPATIWKWARLKAICPIGDVGDLAAQAGHDLLLVCHDLNAQKEVYYKLLEAYKSKQLPLKELEESAARIKKLKLKREKRFEGGEPCARTRRLRFGGKNLP